MDPRIGIGNDLHRLETGSGFMLGGVHIKCDLAVSAHSDGDVLLHALTDALLGAMAGGDIGDLFPATEENRNRPSKDFVMNAVQKVAEGGYRIANIDAIVALEKPKLGERKTQIREKIAGLCSLPVAAVGVKAKTAEEVGPVGRGEAVAAQVGVLLVPDQEG